MSKSDWADVGRQVVLQFLRVLLLYLTWWGAKLTDMTPESLTDPSYGWCFVVAMGHDILQLGRKVRCEKDCG